MRTQEISRQAASGNKPELPSMTAEELCLYYTLMHIYALCRLKRMTLDEGRRAKAQAVSLCEGFEREHEGCKRVYGIYQDNIKRYHDEITIIEKSRDKDEMLLSAMKIIGMIQGDESFEGRQEGKI